MLTPILNLFSWVMVSNFRSLILVMVNFALHLLFFIFVRFYIFLQCSIIFFLSIGFVKIMLVLFILMLVVFRSLIFLRRSPSTRVSVRMVFIPSMDSLSRLGTLASLLFFLVLPRLLQVLTTPKLAYHLFVLMFPQLLFGTCG